MLLLQPTQPNISSTECPRSEKLREMDMSDHSFKRGCLNILTRFIRDGLIRESVLPMFLKHKTQTENVCEHHGGLSDDGRQMQHFAAQGDLLGISLSASDSGTRHSDPRKMMVALRIAEGRHRGQIPGVWKRYNPKWPAHCPLVPTFQFVELRAATSSPMRSRLDTIAENVDNIIPKIALPKQQVTSKLFIARKTVICAMCSLRLSSKKFPYTKQLA